MPKIKSIFIILFISTNIFAAEECLEISEKQMSEWMSAQPALPDFSFLISAKKIIDAERSYSLKLGNDKRAHCYLGCRIAGEVNFETAQFAAWQKEYNDATDCNTKSHFEIADYEATIKGAKRGSEKPQLRKTKKTCTDYCKKTY